MQDTTANTTVESRAAEHAARAGFTLIELLIVIAILGTLAAMVMPNFTGTTEKAKVAATRNSIGGIFSAIQQYETTTSKLPNSFDDLTAGDDDHPPFLQKSKLNDDWGTPFQFKKTGKWKIEVRSAGPDAQMGTEDDIFDRNYDD